MRTRNLAVALSAAAWAAPACTEVEPTPPSESVNVAPAATALPADHGEIPAPGTAKADVAFVPPAGWEAETPGSSMRHSQYRLPGDGGDAQVIVFYFGPSGAGSIEANVQRWCGQFAQPDGSDSRQAATLTERDVNGMSVKEIDLSGTYVAETTPGSGVRLNEPDWRLLGAIVETPDGPYYIKLTGPESTVERWAESFREFIGSAAAP